MAITANVIPVGQPPASAVPFFASLYSADASGGEDLKAAVVGKSIFVKKMQILTDVTGTISIGAGQATGITTMYIGPISVAEEGSDIIIEFPEKQQMKVAEGVALSIDTSGAIPITVLIEGSIGD